MFKPLLLTLALATVTALAAEPAAPAVAPAYTSAPLAPREPLAPGVKPFQRLARETVGLTVPNVPGASTVGTKIGPSRYSCRSVPQMPHHSTSTLTVPGLVTGSGISCGTGGTTCTSNLPTGTVVKLTETAATRF